MICDQWFEMFNEFNQRRLALNYFSNILFFQFIGISQLNLEPVKTTQKENKTYGGNLILFIIL